MTMPETSPDESRSDVLMVAVRLQPTELPAKPSPRRVATAEVGTYFISMNKFSKTSSLLAACMLVMIAFGCEKQRTACLYEIPEGFKGWVLIEFGRTNCPPLSKKNGKLFIPINSDGQCCTSSELEEGWAKDTYFFVGKSRTEIRATGWGGGGLIWGGSTGCAQQQGKPDRIYENFFVGTEDEFNHAPESPNPE